MKNILKHWLEIGIDGIRIDALKHVYESKSMLDEPIINKTSPITYENMDHVYTVDQDEVYDLIREWRLILDEYTQKYDTKRFALRLLVYLWLCSFIFYILSISMLLSY